MAKKSRRVRRKGAQRRLSQAQLVQPVVREGSPAVEAAVVEPQRQPEALDFQDEYRYVVSDLQRIGILAAVMLGGLVILSFIL